MPIIPWLENELVRFLPVGDNQPEGNTTVRRVLVPFNYQYLTDLKAALMGWTTMDEAGNLIRRLPYKDPDDESQYVTRVSHQAVAYDGDRILSSTEDEVPFTTAVTARYWLLTIYFQTLPYDVGPISQVLGDPPIIYGASVTSETERYAVKDVQPGREFINPPSGNFYFEGTNEAIPIPIPVILPFEELDTTWFQVPVEAYPVTAIRDCLGKVNVVEMTMPALPDGVTTYAAETIHLLAIRAIPQFSPYGGRLVNLMYQFRFRGGGGATWNKFPTPTGALVKIKRGTDSAAKSLFDVTDFNNLFRTDDAFEPYVP